MLWFATRSTAEIALLLLSAVTVLGVVTSGGWVHRWWPRTMTTGLHRNLSLLAVVFLSVHVLTTVADGYVSVDLVDVVLPFASPYKTFWIGLGAVAVDLLVVLVVTSLIRTRLTAGVWKGLHWTAYACWAIASAHAIGAGTDALLTFVLATAGASAVAAAVVARYGFAREESYA